MKCKTHQLMALLFAVATVTACAEVPQFTTADKDGVLSIEEARDALPDDNKDGVVNHAEVEKAIQGLDLSQTARAGSDATATVGVNDCRMIIQAMDRPRQDA